MWKFCGNSFRRVLGENFPTVKFGYTFGILSSASNKWYNFFPVGGWVVTLGGKRILQNAYLFLNKGNCFH